MVLESYEFFRLVLIGIYVEITIRPEIINFHAIITTFRGKNKPIVIPGTSLLQLLVATFASLIITSQSPAGDTCPSSTKSVIVDNCGLVVDAGPDKLVCPDDPNTVLEGRASGSGIRGYEWSPPDGLSSTTALRPRVSVSGPQCYVLTAKKKDNINLVTNGNFEAGTTGFTTDYIPGMMSCYGLGFLDCEGTYGVISNPQLGHANFAPCGDHTSGSGNMMVCNGAPGFVNVWCQTIPVTPGRDYCISAWAASVNPSSPAQLEYSINGVPIGFLSLSGSTCVWEELTADWNSGGSALATICIVNQNTAGSGNDFAIDDIEMYEICEQYDTVCVDIVDMQVNILPPPRICCDAPIIQLDGSGSSMGPGYTYCWTASNGGRILSGEQTLMPFVDKPGTYTLMVKGPEGCTLETEVEVEGNIIPPRVYTRVTDTLDCDHPEVEVFGGANPNDGVTYEWSGPNGFFSFDESPSVSDSGWYTLVVTDECGCFGIDSVFVHAKDDVLNVSISGDSLTCENLAVVISANSNDPNADLSWSGPMGFSCDSSYCEVTDTGWYYLFGSTSEGCEDVDSFYVGGDLDLPDLSLSGDTITCAKDTVQIKITSSAGQGFIWKSGNDTIASDSTFMAHKPGWYTGIVQGKNGCTDSASIYVPIDTAKPLFEISGYDIACDSVDSELCFRLPSGSIGPDHEWQLPNGTRSKDSCFRSGLEGWYLLNIYPENGCNGSDSIFINKLDSRPDIDLGQIKIDCNVPELWLAHPDFSDSTLWILPDGTLTYSDSLLVSTEGWYHYSIPAGSYECPSSDSIFVQSDFSKPSATLGSDTLTCTRDSVLLVVTTADTIAEYNWSGPQGYSNNSKMPVVTEPGAYTLILTGENGCQDTFYTTVERSSDYPSVSIISDTITCADPSVQVIISSSSSDLSYQWTGPGGLSGTDSLFSTSISGYYEVTVVSSQGCTIQRRLNVPIDTVHPIVNLSEIDTLTCDRRSYWVYATTSEQKKTVDWRFPDGSNLTEDSISISTSGGYALSVIAANGCRYDTTFFVAIDTASPVFDIMGDTINCRDTLAMLQIDSVGKFDLIWTLPDGTSSSDGILQTSIPGRYTLRGTAGNGCEKSKIYDLSIDTVSPTLELIGDSINCLEREVWLIARSNNSRVQWSKGSQTWSGDSIFINAGGTYIATATADNHCNSVKQILVDVDTTMPAVVGHGDTITCEKLEAKASLSTDPNNTVYWINANGDTLGSDLLLKTSVPGTFNAVVVNPINGCWNQTDVLIFDSRDLPNSVLDIIQPDCELNEGRLIVSNTSGGEAPYRYSLDGISYSNSSAFDALPPGTYEIYTLDANGCENVDTFVITSVDPSISYVTSLIEIDLGDTVLLKLDITPDINSIKSIRWRPAEYISCDTCATTKVYPPTTTEYLVVVTDTHGCEQVLEVLVKVDLPRIYVPNVFSPKGSPGLNDTFFPLSNVPEQVTIDKMYVYSRWGELVFYLEDFHPNDPQKGWDGLFNDELLNPAVFAYLIVGHYSNGAAFELYGDVTILD